MNGIKHDDGKTKWHILPFDSIECLVKIMEHGAAKYDEDNWRKMEDPMRYIDACIRHMAAWIDGEINDIESGKSHLHHAGCNIIFAIWFELKGKLKPNRIEIEKGERTNYCVHCNKMYLGHFNKCPECGKGKYIKENK